MLETIIKTAGWPTERAKHHQQTVKFMAVHVGQCQGLHALLILHCDVHVEALKGSTLTQHSFGNGISKRNAGYKLAMS